ncbi:hypothetical protein EYC84_009164 [Monilinia fructicola]|uniref:Uncharacterized protein n=1 Tax=Monilinia fructicola TaxID=38448 RepID=A0A5M9JDD0_MONFR|nr:hypothetical protein EYC84_009164 [Monilinia fructicola]
MVPLSVIAKNSWNNVAKRKSSVEPIRKELRLQAKIDEEARREAALVSARSSPAGKLAQPPHSAHPKTIFAFGRVAFADGQGP